MGVDAQRRWHLELYVLASGRIKVRLLGDGRTVECVCLSPCQAMDVIDRSLAQFATHTDELVLCKRDVLGSTEFWVTSSRWAGLYWCAAVLSKSWPPAWVPLVERRGARRLVSPHELEPPLIERRTQPRTAAEPRKLREAG